MNANELMIGDKVKYQPYSKWKTGTVILLDAINDEAMFNEDFDLWVEAKYFQPIPLTPEILEKNGLDKVPELSMVLNRDTMPMYHSPILHSVHELQHALRLCGLNDLADNFKV